MQASINSPCVVVMFLKVTSPLEKETVLVRLHVNVGTHSIVFLQWLVLSLSTRTVPPT